MKRILVLLLFSVLMSGTAAFAQEEGGEQHEAEQEESPLATAFRWGNAILLFGGLAFLLRKPAREFFENRKKQIASGLERAKEAETEANARMDEIEQRLASLSADISALRSEAEREAATERDKILADAKREVARIVDLSRQEIERVGRTIEREIKEKVADSVVDRAGRTLQTQMTEDDQKRVVVRFIKKL
jgi:F-type H+-transporting ATPase subunit b